MNLTIDGSLIESFPFASINSNYIPSDSETREIVAFLAEPTKAVDQMKAELDSLYQEILALEKKHDNLDRQVVACRSLITLSRRLPDDILREIFHQSPQCASAQRHYHWRQIALSTPTIWMTIHIPVICRQRRLSLDSNLFTDEQVPGVWDEYRAAAVLAWLQRSGTLPLHISLVGNMPHIPSTAFIDLYFESIIPFAPRWKSLFLQGTYPSFTRFWTHPASDFGCLESLFLDLEPHSRNDPWNDIISSWAGCELLRSPSLRRLSIRQETIDLTRFQVNWSHLTHLALGAPSRTWPYSNYLPLLMTSTIFRSSPGLIHCHLYFGSLWNMDTEVLPMYLPLLRRLSIQTCCNISPLINMLDAPVLEELEFHSAEITAGLECLASLFERPNKIRKLVIDSEQLTHTSFLDCLRRCSGLVSLTAKRSPSSEANYYEHLAAATLFKFRIDDRFLEFLGMNDDDDADSFCCPHLEELICDYIDDFFWPGR